MPEEMLVETCSPVLAGIKTANLISVPYSDKASLQKDLQEMNGVFVRKGVRVVPLGRLKTREMLYVYRPDYLNHDMNNLTARKILRQLGYEISGQNGAGCDYLVAQLGRRFRQHENFPHEIGLFLGYPAEDVKGYLDHNGRDCKYTGYWKVYTDETAARKVFERYRRCTDTYRADWHHGLSIDHLTVKVSAKARTA